MRHPFELDAAPEPLTVTVSVGIAVGDRGSPGELFGTQTWRCTWPRLRGRTAMRCSVLRWTPISAAPTSWSSTCDALELRSVSPCLPTHLQPGRPLPRRSRGSVALGSPEPGEVQPDEFITAEASGRIIEVGRWVLIEACRQTASWHARGNDLRVSVNVSGRQLDHDDVVDDVRDALMLSGLDPRLLTVEVTETALMRNTEMTARRLRQLKALGVKLAIDDFGTGYSSLAYLAQVSGRLPQDRPRSPVP